MNCLRLRPRPIRRPRAGGLQRTAPSSYDATGRTQEIWRCGHVVDRPCLQPPSALSQQPLFSRQPPPIVYQWSEYAHNVCSFGLKVGLHHPPPPSLIGPSCPVTVSPSLHRDPQARGCTGTAPRNVAYSAPDCHVPNALANPCLSPSIIRDMAGPLTSKHRFCPRAPVAWA